MITLSVKQPWAYLLCAGVKSIENRTWKLPEKYKGKRVLIHASAKRDNIYDRPNWELIDKELRKIPIKDFHIKDGLCSAIIGSVVVSDCVINHPSVWAEKTPVTKLYDEWQKPVYNWVLSKPILFDKPILNVKGRLNFWEYDGEVIKAMNYDTDR